jgi:hypothetical protein
MVSAQPLPFMSLLLGGVVRARLPLGVFALSRVRKSGLPIFAKNSAKTKDSKQALVGEAGNVCLEGVATEQRQGRPEEDFQVGHE